MKKFYQIMRTPLFDLNSEEIKYYSFGIFVLCILASIIESIFISLLINTFKYFLISLIGFLIGSFILSLWTYKRDWMIEKYNLKINHGIPNQMVIIMLFGASVMLSSGISVIAFNQGGIYSAISFCIANLLPSIFMYLRINVYNDQDRIIKDEFGNAYLERTAYNPLFFYVIGIMISNGPVAVSILKVLKNTIPFSYLFNYYLLFCILSVIFLFLCLSPDILSKFVPFEMNLVESKKFFIFSLIISVLLLLFLVG